MQEIIDKIKAQIATYSDEVESLRIAAIRLPILENELAVLNKMLADAEPTQPAPRKPRSDNGTKRAKVNAPVVPVGHGSAAGSAGARCSECHAAIGTADNPTVHCGADGCDAILCGGCIDHHTARWHREGA